MARKTIEVEVNKREPGKSLSRGLRRQMRTPGVVYGPSIEPVSIEVDERAVMKYRTSAYENAILQLKSEDKTINNISVLMKKVDIHPVTRKPVHVDFHAMNMNETVHVDVEVHTEGTPAGIKDGGATLEVAHRHFQVECLPKDIPEHFTLDVSHLEIGESIHVSDLKLPDNVKAISNPTMTLVTLTAPRGGSDEEEKTITDPATVPAQNSKESKE